MIDGISRGPVTRKGRSAPSVRRLGKALIRRYGMATSGLRAFPDFLVIGAKRGGTTSIYNYLLAHPSVVPPFPRRQRIKGVHFFDVNFRRGVAWYRSHFPTSGSMRGRIVGEASPYYLGHPRAAARARMVVPEARIILLLRDPVQRAYSHYRERVRNGWEDLSFEDAIAREHARLEGEEELMLADERYVSPAHEHYGYLAQGRYPELLERWFSLFPRERIFIGLSEDLYRDPAGLYADLLRFLGLPAFEPDEYRPFNLHPSTPMPQSMRDWLSGYFAPHNERLQTMVDLDLGGWETP